MKIKIKIGMAMLLMTTFASQAQKNPTLSLSWAMILDG